MLFRKPRKILTVRAKSSPRLRSRWALALAVCAFPHNVRAEEEAPKDKPAERRSGLVLGLTAGISLSGASGYPNDIQKIDKPQYYSSSPLLVGSTNGITVMGALSDVFNFGVMFTSNSSVGNDRWKSSVTGVGFRVEAFPLYSVRPWLRDLGFFGQFGVGVAQLQAQGGSYPAAEGVQSYVGLGTFYEWNVARFLGGHLALGPSIEAAVMTSRPIEHHYGALSFRIVFYGGK